MVSSTRQTERRRAIRARAFGKGKKLEQTPKFPVHPEGYDAKKADAIRAALAQKAGIRRIARDLGVGVGTVIRIRDAGKSLGTRL